jgi:capsular polysaccharide biosynthesis protein
MDDSQPIIDITAHPSGFVPADDIWGFLRRRKLSIVLMWIVGLGGLLWWILSWPSVYQAESRVMIVRLGSGGPVSEAELASEIELVRDPSHLERAATKQLISPTDAQIHRLQRKMDSSLIVAPAGKSNLVAVAYRDSDPTAAARIVNQVVELYLADRRFIFQLNGQSAARPPTDSSSPASDLLSAFDMVNHGSQLRTELQSRVQHRIELEGRRTDLKAHIRDNQETANALRKRFGSLPDRIASRTRTRKSPNPSNRLVEETEVVNPLRQQIESELIRKDTEVAGLEARLEETDTALREAHVAEEQISTLSSERDRLERRANDTRIAAELGAPSSTDRPNLRATLINRAEPPYAPLPENLLLWIPLAALATLAAALLIAWIIDQFDKPIYTPDDFEDASGVPPVERFARGAGA